MVMDDVVAEQGGSAAGTTQPPTAPDLVASRNRSDFLPSAQIAPHCTYVSTAIMQGDYYKACFAEMIGVAASRPMCPN